jgi:DNA-binding MarR family transcriptional regulator
MDAAASLGVRFPTLSEVVKNLVQKRWVTNRWSAMDTRAVCLSRGEALALQIEQRVRQVRATLTEQDRRALGINLKGSRA